MGPSVGPAVGPAMGPAMGPGGGYPEVDAYPEADEAYPEAPGADAQGPSVGPAMGSADAAAYPEADEAYPEVSAQALEQQAEEPQEEVTAASLVRGNRATAEDLMAQAEQDLARGPMPVSARKARLPPAAGEGEAKLPKGADQGYGDLDEEGYNGMGGGHVAHVVDSDEEDIDPFAQYQVHLRPQALLHCYR